MTDDANMVAYSAVLACVMVISAAMIRTSGSIPLMFGNRDNLPPPTPLAERADRAAKNMLENLVMFTAAYVAAKTAGASGWKVTLGAQIFFFARLAYFPLYLAGVKVVRSLSWGIALAGTGLLAAAAITAG